MSAKEMLDFVEKAYKEGNMPVWDYEKFKEEFKEKTAREMFEEYGFTLYDETDEILIYSTDHDSEMQEDDHYIRFDKLCKCIYSNKEFNIYELKMINKQIEELGWK